MKNNEKINFFLFFSYFFFNLKNFIINFIIKIIYIYNFNTYQHSVIITTMLIKNIIKFEIIK